MDIKRSSPIPVFLLVALSIAFASGEIQGELRIINSGSSAVSAAETRLRRAPAATPAPAGGFFGGGFMQFLMQALCLQITAGGGIGGVGLGGGLGPLLLGIGRKRRGAGGRGGNRAPRPRPRPRPFGSTPNFGFNSNRGNALGLLQNNILGRLGIRAGSTPAQILSNPRVRAVLASNPRTSQQLNSVMANQAVGGAGGGGGGGISTDQLVNLVMQAMCLQQQAAAAATPLPAALTNRRPRPRPGRG